MYLHDYAFEFSSDLFVLLDSCFPRTVHLDMYGIHVNKYVDKCFYICLHFLANLWGNFISESDIL